MDLTPPTDNLYKFIAILGISMVLGSSWMMSELWKSEFESRFPIIERALAQIGEDGIKNQLEWDKLKAHADFRNKLVAWFSSMYFFSFLVGAIIAVFGLVLWYLKLQIHLDKLQERKSKAS